MQNAPTKPHSNVQAKNNNNHPNSTMNVAENTTTKQKNNKSNGGCCCNLMTCRKRAPSGCITIMNVLLVLFILQGLFGLFSSFILLYTTGDNIIQRSIAKQKLQMNLVVDHELSELIKTTSFAINQILYQLPDINLNDNLSWVKLFFYLKKLYQYKLPIQMSYFGRFDQSMIGVEQTYVRIYHKNQNYSSEVNRPITDYGFIADLDNILNPSNVINYTPNSTMDMTARPWFKPFLNTTNTKIMWSPLFYAAASKLPSITASIPVYINNQTSTLNDNYWNSSMYWSATAPRNPSHLYGVIGVQLQMNNISNILTQAAIRAGVAASFIINSQGQVVASTRYVGSPVMSPSESDQIISALVNETISRGFLQQINDWKNLPENQHLNGLAIKESASFSFKGKTTPQLDVVLFTITDQYGLNWGSVIVVPQRVFVEEVFQSSISSVVIFAVVLLLGLLILISVVLGIQISLRNIKKQMMELVNFNNSKTNSDNDSSFSLLYDIRQMQQSLNIMREGLGIFSKYVPDVVIKQTGEQVISKNMSVMIIEIPEFSLLAENSDRVSFIAQSTDLFSELYSLIEKNKGTLDRYIRNRVVAFWNESQEESNHELLACSTALQILHTLTKLQEQWQQCSYQNLNVVLSVNSGELLSGNIGTSTRLNFTVFGDAVNITAGLVSLNRKFQTRVLIGQQTFEKVKNHMVCYFVDFIAVRGKEKPTIVYSLECATRDASQHQLVIREYLSEIENCFFAFNFARILEISDTLERQNLISPSIAGIVEHLKQRASCLLNVNAMTLESLVFHANG